MTKDHIVPRSKGGGNGLHNMQTMCIVCNQEKGNGNQKSVYCHKNKLYKKIWTINENELVCKTSRKKFQSGNRVEKVLEFTSKIIHNIEVSFIVLTNCSATVPATAVNNDPEELILMQERDKIQQGVKNV